MLELVQVLETELVQEPVPVQVLEQVQVQVQVQVLEPELVQEPVLHNQ
ncbi:MAG: hypothetical protein WBB97_03620 [Dehalococcoidales bacterium]